MAVDLTTAQKYYQQYGHGAQPPAGQSFESWVLQWFSNAVDAGVPSAVQASGGSSAEEGDGGIADWKSAAPASEWMGKRNPTPRELRRWAHDTGKPEDYQRFDDKQLAAWINDSWKGDHFENDYGDIVDKPTESGPKSQAAGAATGEGPQHGGGAGGGGGGGAAKPAAAAGADWTGTINQDLQDKLVNMFQTGGGAYSSTPYGMQLENGGMVTSDTTPKAGSVAVGVAPGVTPVAKGGGGNVPSPAGGFVANAGPSVSAPLLNATLNAFSPQAPSKQASDGVVSQPVAPAAPVSPAAPKAPSPAAPAPVTPPAPGAVPQQAAPGASSLQDILKNRFTQPNQWWAAGKK